LINVAVLSRNGGSSQGGKPHETRREETFLGANYSSEHKVDKCDGFEQKGGLPPVKNREGEGGLIPSVSPLFVSFIKNVGDIPAHF